MYCLHKTEPQQINVKQMRLQKQALSPIKFPNDQKADREKDQLNPVSENRDSELVQHKRKKTKKKPQSTLTKSILS